MSSSTAPTSFVQWGAIQVPVQCGTPVRALRRPYHRVKRCFDVAACILLLPFVLPVLAVCAALIILEDGRPVFFRQMRTGKGGKRFPMFKLRTMVKNAEELKHQLAHLNELAWPDFKITRDPRISRVGRLLRKASLDELPQVFNVLRGEMSLVGPRPTSFAAGTYDLRHTERLEALPGITGLWQISGRGDIGFDDRLQLDVEYIERQSFGFDLLILWRTVFAVLGGRGAY